MRFDYRTISAPSVTAVFILANLCSAVVTYMFQVVLPLMHAYFNAHRNYFLASSSIVQTGTASNKEKEMIAKFVFAAFHSSFKHSASDILLSDYHY